MVARRQIVKNYKIGKKLEIMASLVTFIFNPSTQEAASGRSL